jgi:hypothetical protein
MEWKYLTSSVIKEVQISTNIGKSYGHSFMEFAGINPSALSGKWYNNKQ